MDLHNLASVLVYIHATFGGISLLAGTGAALSKKGGTLHKWFGKVFFYSLLLSSLVALAITFIPKHHNVFLFCIGVFSIYQIASGYRALWYKRNPSKEWFDKMLAAALLITAIAMVVYGFVVSGGLQILLFVFGAFCLWMSLEDLFLYRNKQKRLDKWLSIHINRMSGGFIASVTAFVVVNHIFPGIVGWFLPGIIGGFLIARAQRKWKLKPNSKAGSEQ